MVVIWERERGKGACGVLRVDSDVYAALIPKVQIAARIRGEMETDVLDTGVQGRTTRWWNTLKSYPGVWLLTQEDLWSVPFLQHVQVQGNKKKEKKKESPSFL